MLCSPKALNQLLGHQPSTPMPMSGALINLLRFCYVLVQESSLSPIPFAIEEAVLQDGHKQCLAFKAASKRGSDKQCRTCCYREECELTTKVLA